MPKPLYEILKNTKEKIEPSEQYKQIIANIKEIVSCDIKLIIPGVNICFILTTGASKFAFGAVLTQKTQSRSNYCNLQ